MKWTTMAAVAAAAMISTACAMPGTLARGGEELPDPEAMRRAQEAAERGALRPLSQGFVNPSFEDVTGSQPVGWGRIGTGPEVRSGPAADGARYAHVNQRFFYQEFDFDLPAWQAATIGCSVSGRTGLELPRLLLEIPGVFLQPERVEFPGTGWVDYCATITKEGTGVVPLLVRLASRFPIGWAHYDDVYVLYEDGGDGDFEGAAEDVRGREGWALGDGAAITESAALEGSRGLLLPPGGRAERLLAHSDVAPRYFVTGTFSGELTVWEERQNNAGRPLGQAPTRAAKSPPELPIPKLSLASREDLPTSHTFTSAAPARFLADWGHTEGAQRVRLCLSNSGTTTTLVDDVTRGFAYAFPGHFWPVENSPAPTLRLACAWPGRLLAAEISIRDEFGGEVDFISGLTRDGSSAWTDYDGAGLADGAYVARFLLCDDRGNDVAVDRPFSLSRPTIPEAPAPAMQGDFLRGGWVFGIRAPEDITVEGAMEWLRPLQNDGYDYVHLTLFQTQLAPFIAAAEELKLPFILDVPEFVSSLRDPPGGFFYNPVRSLGRLDPVLPFLDSPMFMGLYMYDEPLGVFLGRARRLAAYLESTGDFPQSYSVLSEVATPDDVEELSTATISELAYPFTRDQRTMRERILHVENNVGEDLNRAHALGRPFTFVPQGFQNFPITMLASANEARAYLGAVLSLGVNSIEVFLHTQVGTIVGLRDINWEPTPALAAFQEFNTRVDILAPVLRELSYEPTIKLQDQHIYARSMRSGDQRIVTVVNAYADRTVTWSGATSAETVLTDLVAGAVHSTGTSHSGQLPPGEWVMLGTPDDVEFLNFSGLPGPIQLPAPVPAFVTGSLLVDRIPETLTISPDGTLLGFTDSDNGEVRSLREDDFGTVLLREFLGGGSYSGMAQFLDDGSFQMGSEGWGLRVYSNTEGTLTESRRFWKESGGGKGYVPVEAERAWLGGAYFGPSLLRFDGHSEFTVERQFYTGASSFELLHGPFDGGAVLGVTRTGGIWRFSPDDDSLFGERLTENRNAFRSALSPGRSRLAVPNFGTGVTVYDVTADGYLADERRLRFDASISEEFAAWLDDENLVISDARAGLHFIRAASGEDPQYLGTWLPAIPPFVITGLAAGPGGMLAVGLQTREILLVDASGVADFRRASAWILEGE